MGRMKPPAVIAIVVLLAGCGSTEAQQEPAGCPDTTIVGIRGQGQSLEANGGLGAEVRGIAEDVAEELGGDVDVQAVRHRSRPAGMAEYIQDVAEGRQLLRSAVRTAAADCPDAQIIVIGFSQGSQIARAELAARPALADEVAALVLVGSPVRDPASPVHRVDLVGPEPTSGGSLGPGPDLGDLASLTVEACIIGDVVCAHDGTSLDYTVHKHAYEARQVQQSIADATVDLLR